MRPQSVIKILAILVAFAFCVSEAAYAQRGGGGRGGGGGGARAGSSMRGGGSGYARGGGSVRGSRTNRSWNGGNYGGRYAGGSRYSSGYRGYPYAGGSRYSSAYRGYGRYGGGYGYGSGYRGYPGFGAAYGRYGYGYFPWYGGIGFYGGLAGISRAFGNGIYGSGYYNNGTTTVYQEQPQPVEDYVPQVNTTNAQLATGAAGNAVLGVTMDPEYTAAAVVRSVTPGSPAEVAGLRPGDMIASIKDRVIESLNNVVDLIAQLRPGDLVQIKFVRPIPRSQVKQAAPEVQSQQ